MIPMLFAGLLAAAPAPADTVIGQWRTETKHGVVRIERCGASLCGRLMSSDGLRADPGLTDSKNKDEKLRGRPLKGVLMLSGFKWDDGVWTDGQVYNPDDGRTYSGKITIIDADHLKLRGCVFVPLCKTQTWTRVH